MTLHTATLIMATRQIKVLINHAYIDLEFQKSLQY